MGEFALYKAIHSYTPSANDELALTYQKDDVFEISVQSPCIDSDLDTKERKGWLYAYNRCTGAEGYVKVEHVELLGSAVNNTIHHPSAPGVIQHSINGSTSVVIDYISGHRLKDVYFLTPILCKHCDDYIWGPGKVGQQCEGSYSIILKRHCPRNIRKDKKKYRSFQICNNTKVWLFKIFDI